MKKYYIILLFLMPTHLLALPCQNGGIIYKGNTIKQVKKICGQPDSETRYNKVINIVEKWVYFQANLTSSYNTKVTFILQNNNIINIKLHHKNLSSISFCHSILSLGNNAKDLIGACGNPAYKETIQMDTIPVTRLKYHGAPAETLIFENGHFTDFK